VTIATLGDGEKKIPARVTNASHQGLGLISTSAVPTGTAIKIELDDAYVLGEAVYCREQPEGGWMIGVELSQVLTGLSELGRRLRAYARTPLGGEGLHTVHDRETQNR